MANDLAATKLKKEIRMLDLQLVGLRWERRLPRFQRWAKYHMPAFAACLAVLVSAVSVITSGLSLGINAWVAHTGMSAARAKERSDLALEFRETLKAATEVNASDELRVAAIWRLNGFWDTEHENALANALAPMLVSTNQQVRIAAAEVIGEAYGEGTPQILKERRARLLYGSESGDWGVVLRQEEIFRKHPPEESREEIRQALVDAVRKNWEWLVNVRLRDADLSEGEFYEADLRGADLRGVNFTGANLCDANLTGAKIDDIKLHGANLRGVKGLDSVPSDAKLHAVYLSKDEWFARRDSKKQIETRRAESGDSPNPTPLPRP